MALGNEIHTWFAGRWHEGNVPLLGSADHATWLGTLVFDGARRFEGVAPDLDRHCRRLNASALSTGLRPVLEADAIEALCLEGLDRFAPQTAVYIRPMYWSVQGGPGSVVADPDSTAFALCLESCAMPAPSTSITLGRTRFCRPTYAQAPVDAKAACLYPHNGRMLREVQSKGFDNAIVLDALGNVAETASANLFMARDGDVFTPVPNGTFLDGITRQRLITLLRADGVVVHECCLGLDDFAAADEVFTSGNMSKVMPVSRIEGRRYEIGPMARRARELYWDWALRA